MSRSVASPSLEPADPAMVSERGRCGLSLGEIGVLAWPGLALRLGLAVAMVAFFVWQSFYDHAADFKSFYSAGYAVRDRSVPLYDLVALEDNPFGEVFKLPPTAAVYLVPVSFGTVQQARLVWRLLLVAGFVLAYVVLTHGLGVRRLGWRWLAGLGLWSIFGPLQIAVGEGQWDPIFLLLIVLATTGVAERRPLLAALPVAVAATIKPYPIVLAGFFLARRWWRELLLTGGAAVVLFALGAAVVGTEGTSIFLTRVLPASGVTTAYADNQSLGGVIARLVGSDLKPLPLRDAGPIDATIRVVALIALAGSVWIVSRAPAGDGLTQGLQLGLFVPLSILIVPAAWSHYQTILLVPLTLLAVDQLRRAPHGWATWGILGLAYLLLMLPNPSMLYGGEIERNLWLRSKADGANLALQYLYPSALSRLILSYKTLGAIVLYALVARRVARAPSPNADAVPAYVGTVA